MDEAPAVGYVHGRWTVVDVYKQSAWFVRERCTCGHERKLHDKHFYLSHSCLNCRQEEHAKLRAEYYSRFGSLPEDFRALLYTARGCIERCTDATHKDYEYYGGRGIRVCEEWLSDPLTFVVHLATLERGTYFSKHSYRVLNLTINRIDNDRGYEPGNVDFATKSEQCYNKRNPPQKRSERGQMLTPELERTIRRLYTKGVRAFEIAQLYCVKTRTILAVCGRIGKGHIPDLRSRVGGSEASLSGGESDSP